MMTVLNENKFQKKHTHLLYIEFLEMLCRVAHQINPEPIEIAQKVHFLLDKLYTRRYNLGLNTPKPGDLELLPIAKRVEESDENEDGKSDF